ncbi:MAG: endonuclease NucS [Acidobacteriia bacterium]|nr:endonuclease NucS [Terriglobia bacterium]
MANWKINCMENEYPGLWHTWFKEQIVAVGWPPDDYGLRTPTKVRAWSDARRYLMQIEPDDKVVVQLKNWRVGRIGTVLSKQIEDKEWNPSVPRQAGDSGEMGRRVQVRWDLTTGPLAPSFVVELPPEARPNPRIWRPTLSQVPDSAFRAMEIAINEDANWVSLIPGFASERALSEYISASPHLLEDGLVPYPSESARELVFADRTRLDVLLLDRDGNIVIVECKQGTPSLQHIEQLRGYMRNAEKLRTGLKIGKNIRGILVHGGARKLSSEVRKESRHAPHIELVQFSVSVGFTPSL